jgi:hypothetical protein
MTQWEAFDKLRSIQDELEAARFSISRTLREVYSDATTLAETDYVLRPSQIRDCAVNLDVTYLLRLFAEYEGILRDFWAAIRPSPHRRLTRMEVLMDRIATVRQIPRDVIEDAHEVRDFRNAFIHDHSHADNLIFGECKSRLSFFISYLPRMW